MKKIVIALLCVCLLLAGALLAFNYGGQSPDTAEPKAANAVSNTVESNNAADSDASAGAGNTADSNASARTIQSMDTSADVAVIYSDYKSLIADSELVVFGTVKELKSYSAVPVPINTEVTLSIEDVLKGEADGDSLNYTVYGGRMPVLEWYEANSEKLKDKLTAEVFEKELSAMKSTDMVESTFMGVENVEIGDQVLVFLVFDDVTGSFGIRASSYNGQFFFDRESDSFYKVIDGEKSMFAEYTEVKSLAQTTPDNSENLKREMENRGYVEDDGVIIEKDPAFDKYKGE